MLLVFVTLVLQTEAQQTVSNFHFHNGDLLFQDLDCGELCDAIEKVTPSIHGKHYSHIGLVYQKVDSWYVIEAIAKDVHLVPLDRFLHRQMDKQGHPKITVGRLRKRYENLTPAAIAFALAQIGTSYDDEFLYGNGKYY